MRKVSNKIIIFIPEIFYFIFMAFLLLKNDIFIAIASFIMAIISEIYIRSKVKIKNPPLLLNALYVLAVIFFYEKGLYGLCFLLLLIYIIVKLIYNKKLVFELGK